MGDSIKSLAKVNIRSITAFPSFTEHVFSRERATRFIVIFPCVNPC